MRHTRIGFGLQAKQKKISHLLGVRLLFTSSRAPLDADSVTEGLRVAGLKGSLADSVFSVLMWNSWKVGGGLMMAGS